MKRGRPPPAKAGAAIRLKRYAPDPNNQARTHGRKAEARAESFAKKSARRQHEAQYLPVDNGKIQAWQV